MEELNLKLKGMSCASCANSIEQAILNVPGVVEGNVNFSIERATVRYDPKQTNINIITKAVVDIGYEAQIIPADLGIEDDTGNRQHSLFQVLIVGIAQHLTTSQIENEWRQNDPLNYSESTHP